MKPGLNFQSAHYRHPNVDHRDSGTMDFGINQELVRVTELFDATTGRTEQAPDRFQYGRVIVEEAYNVSKWVRQSEPRLHSVFARRILDLSLMRL